VKLMQARGTVNSYSNIVTGNKAYENLCIMFG
jgi:hypothetical protein